MKVGRRLPIAHFIKPQWPLGASGLRARSELLMLCPCLASYPEGPIPQMNNGAGGLNFFSFNEREARPPLEVRTPPAAPTVSAAAPGGGLLLRVCCRYSSISSLAPCPAARSSPAHHSPPAHPPPAPHTSRTPSHTPPILSLTPRPRDQTNYTSGPRPASSPCGSSADTDYSPDDWGSGTAARGSA